MCSLGPKIPCHQHHIRIWAKRLIKSSSLSAAMLCSKVPCPACLTGTLRSPSTSRGATALSSNSSFVQYKWLRVIANSPFPSLSLSQRNKLGKSWRLHFFSCVISFGMFGAMPNYPISKQRLLSGKASNAQLAMFGRSPDLGSQAWWSQRVLHGLGKHWQETARNWICNHHGSSDKNIMMTIHYILIVIVQVYVTMIIM